MDLAVDSPPLEAPTVTVVGPTYPPIELAARKLLAPFDRAAARDFVDLAALADHFSLDVLLAKARQLDAGFDTHVLIEMLGQLDRIDDDYLVDLGADPGAVREFARTWARDLDQQ